MLDIKYSDTNNIVARIPSFKQDHIFSDLSTPNVTSQCGAAKTMRGIVMANGRTFVAIDKVTCKKCAARVSR